MEVIILCGRQNISLLGHRDYTKFFDTETVNPGNLQAILQYPAKCRKNEKFTGFVITGSKRVTYRSKITQNELLDITIDITLEKLLADIEKATFFQLWQTTMQMLVMHSNCQL